MSCEDWYNLAVDGWDGKIGVYDRTADRRMNRYVYTVVVYIRGLRVIVDIFERQS